MKLEDVKVKADDGANYDVQTYINWSINQMRRAARLIELLSVGAVLDKKNNYYSPGLDSCADVGEKFLNEMNWHRNEWIQEDEK